MLDPINVFIWDIEYISILKEERENTIINIMDKYLVQILIQQYPHNMVNTC